MFMFEVWINQRIFDCCPNSLSILVNYTIFGTEQYIVKMGLYKFQRKTKLWILLKQVPPTESEYIN